MTPRIPEPMPVKGAARARVFASAVLTAMLLAGGAPGAQGGGARPDLSGFWAPVMRAVQPEAALLDRLAPNTVLIDDAGAPELPAGDFGGLRVKPAALASALAWKPEDDMTLDKACAPPSIIYAMQGPFPMEIHQGTELTVIELEYFDMVRIVFTDGRDRPSAEAPHSKVGYSIGRWEGSMLVVETTHLSAATITNNGLDHSEQVRLTERFMLGADGRTLMATQEFEDPDVLENRGARVMAWTRTAGHVLPYECDPTFAAEFLQRQEAPGGAAPSR